MASIRKLIGDPKKGWCDCTLKTSPQTVWFDNKMLEPIINDSETVKSVTVTPDTYFSYKHSTTSTDTITITPNTNWNLNTISITSPNTITINADNLYPICVGKDYQTKTNKESEDKKVTETKKQPRMFYNVLPYSNKFKIIKYGESVKNSVYIMPEISDVRHITNKDEVIGVEIKFADNTKQKAICSPNDTFNLEQGITICLFKKILENGLVAVNSLCKGRGTSIYNKLVNHALKVMERRIKAEEKAKKEEAEKKEKEQRFIEKKRRADARRAKRESEQRINEMAEAIRRSGIVPNMDDGK